MDIVERNKKVEENLALVTFSLNKLGIRFDEDYFQQGVLELIRCVECFDESRGRKFSTYAVKNITLKLKEYIARDKVLKPKRTGDRGRVYAPFCDSFEREVRNTPGDIVITLGDTIADQHTCEMENVDLLMDIQSLIDRKIISERDYEIFKKVSVYGEKEKVVAKEYNISQPHVARITNNTKTKLKKYLSQSYNNY